MRNLKLRMPWSSAGNSNATPIRHTLVSSPAFQLHRGFQGPALLSALRVLSTLRQQPLPLHHAHFPQRTGGVIYPGYPWLCQCKGDSQKEKEEVHYRLCIHSFIQITTGFQHLRPLVDWSLATFAKRRVTGSLSVWESTAIVLHFVSVSFTWWWHRGTISEVTHWWRHSHLVGGRLLPSRDGCHEVTLQRQERDYEQADWAVLGIPSSVLPSLWTSVLALPFLSQSRGSLELLVLIFKNLSWPVIWQQVGSLIFGRYAEQSGRTSELFRDLLVWSESLNCIICVWKLPGDIEIHRKKSMSMRSIL